MDARPGQHEAREHQTDEFGIPPRARRRRLLAAFFVVVLPTILTAIYAFVIAAPMYETESRFVLRGAESKTSGIGRIMQSFGGGGAGGAAAFFDGFVVRDFLLSTTAKQRLDERINFRQMVVGKGDFLNRVPKDASWEQLYAFYRRNVHVTFNITEGIITLKTYAFSPQDAYRINTALLELTEEFTNDINKRARKDALRLAREEVKQAQELLAKAQEDIRQWRIKHNYIDPEIRTKTISKLIAELEQELVKTYIQLLELDTYNTEKTARRQTLQNRIKAIRTQIAKERRKLAHADNNKSLAAALLDYERLKLAKELAVKNFENAQKLLQAAHFEALRKQKYVIPVAAPVQSRQPAYPKPFIMLLSVFFGTLIAYALGTLIFSAIKDSLDT